MVVDAFTSLGLQFEGWRCWWRNDALPNNVQILLQGEYLSAEPNG